MYTNAMYLNADNTVYSNVEYHVELEDGTLLKCTPNHRFMLKDGTYKEAKDLTVNDELYDVTDTFII